MCVTEVCCSVGSRVGSRSLCRSLRLRGNISQKQPALAFSVRQRDTLSCPLFFFDPKPYATFVAPLALEAPSRDTGTGARSSAASCDEHRLRPHLDNGYLVITPTRSCDEHRLLRPVPQPLGVAPHGLLVARRLALSLAACGPRACEGPRLYAENIPAQSSASWLSRALSLSLPLSGPDEAPG